MAMPVMEVRVMGMRVPEPGVLVAMRVRLALWVVR
jgi:hypothetical protein